MKNSMKLICLILSMLLLCSCSNTIYTVKDTGTSTADFQNTENDTLETEQNISDENGETRIKFLAVGDNMNHSSIIKEASAFAENIDGVDYYYASMYENVASEIRSADIAFVNQEAPIADDAYPVSGYPSFNAPKDAGQALIDLGFDIINLANNHMLDMDTGNRTGYKYSIDYWKTKNVMTIGGYENEEDFNAIRYLTKDGVKIAFLSYTYFTNTNPNTQSTCVVPYAEKDIMAKHISDAKKSSDLVFVSVHWGDEGSFSPNSVQTDLAQFIADQGADVIIGHHSHTIQPIKWLNGKDGNKTLCFYSLGNFICTMLYPYYLLGGIFSFDIVKDDAKNNIYIDNVEYNPLMIHYTADATVHDEQDLPVRSNVKIYYLEDYTDDLISQNGSQLYQSFTKDTLKSYITKTIDTEFLPEWLK